LGSSSSGSSLSVSEIPIYIFTTFRAVLPVIQSTSSFSNFDRWDILGKYVWPNPEPYCKTYKEEIEKLKNWLITRSNWIDENINSL
jgi:hypothetical protein